MAADAQLSQQTLLWERMNATMSAYEASIETHVANALAAQTRLERQLIGALGMVEQIHLLVYSAMAGVFVCAALQIALLVLWLRRKRSDPTFVFV